MLITCPECGHHVSDKAVSCPGCGYPVKISSGNFTARNEAPAKPQSRKKRKHKKLPNGYGSIKNLGAGRRRPFAAYPATTDYTINGVPVAVPAIGYYEDWYSAFDALREYNHNPYDTRNANLTFSQIYQMYYEAKFEKNRKKLSAASRNSSAAAFANCSALHHMKFNEIRKSDLQKVVDNCPLKHASLELIVSLFHGMYRYAMENDLVEKDYSRFVTINIPDDDETGEPFTQADLDLLWQNKDMPGVDTILIMIYSGFRISAYKTMEYNLDERYLKGGVKTAAGKGRTVPIHNAIWPLLEKYNGRTFIVGQIATFRKKFTDTLEILGIAMTANGKKHTPHDCRHTFSWLCDRYGVDDLSKHMLMGHAIGGDVEKAVYGHRTLEELRAEINKIRV